MSRVKILCLLLVVVIGPSHAVTDCTGLTGEHLTNCTFHPENFIVVPTKSGPIGGSSSYSIPAGREFRYFKGVPYAQPPVGKLRMRNPVKVKLWTSTKWSLKHGSVCILNVRPPIYQGSEDCLTLNIYLPKNICNSTNRCPVIFVVHVSNFYSGNRNSNLLGPDRYVAEDVILVVLNYRLAAFGFSNTGDQNIQGNAGLMDQVMALLWIKENIADFGGERAQVTLSGDGASMGYLCTAEYTKGLFSRVIVQTTSSLSGWAFQPEPQKMIKELAEGMNLTYTGLPDLAEKLRNAPIQDILLISGRIRIKYKTMLGSMNGNIAFARYNQKSGTKVYVYLYNLCSETNYMRRTFVSEYSCPKQVGPSFADDAPLIYYQTDLLPYQKLYNPNVIIVHHNDRTEADRRVSAQIIRFFVNFARTSNPNGCGPLDPLFGIEWKPVTDFTDIQTMYFDSTLKMDHHDYQVLRSDHIFTP